VVSAIRWRGRIRTLAPLAFASAIFIMTTTAVAADVSPELATKLTRAVAAARARSESIDAAGFAVQTQVRSAREHRDTVRLACLDTVLTRLHVASRLGRAQVDRIREAAQSGDLETADREGVRLSYLSERSARLTTEALECGGHAASEASPGTTRVRAVAPRLPAADMYPPGR
jgi:hypothetical protein